MISKCLPPIAPILEEAVVKADKQVAHLTLARVDYEKNGKSWLFGQVARRIVGVLSVVVPHIPDAKISAELKAKLSEATLTVPRVKVSSLCDEQSYVGVALALSTKSV